MLSFYLIFSIIIINQIILIIDYICHYTFRAYSYKDASK